MKAKVYSKALNSFIEVERIIGRLKGANKGPTLVFFGGIHGNEPSGVFALKRVFNSLKGIQDKLYGSCYGIAGNLSALEEGKRYHKYDLNRLWTLEKIKHIEEGSLGDSEKKEKDIQELISIYSTIRRIISSEEGPFYFFDLHTTSGDTIPFMTVNDSLLNRKFTSQYPSPIILGIEEYLDGPLLSYINELGYISFGFESGQHDTLEAFENHEAFIYLTTVFTGFAGKTDIDFTYYYKKLCNSSRKANRIFEIYFRHKINGTGDFKMKPGFSNFQKVDKNEALASENGTTLYAEKETMIFMPLYQKQGEDGYFLIQPVRSVFLVLSKIFRKLRVDKVMSYLPGINWASSKQETLLVNKNTARFFAREFLHLMGYRNKTMGKDYLIAKNRESASRNTEYKHEVWN